MGLIDGLLSGIISSVVYAVSGLFNGIGNMLGGAIAKKMRVPERWELIKVDDEEKKFTFNGNLADGYIVTYTGKQEADSRGRLSGTIGKYDLKGFEQKSENAALYFVIYKLELIHDYLKNRELATRMAKKIMADIKEKSAAAPEKK